MRKVLLKKTSLAIFINAVLISYSFAEQEQQQKPPNNIVTDIVSEIWKNNKVEVDKNGKNVTGKNIRDDKSRINDEMESVLFERPRKERDSETTHNALALLGSRIQGNAAYTTALNKSTISWGSHLSFASGKSTIDNFSTHSIAMGESAIERQSDYSTALNKSTIGAFSQNSLAIGQGAKVHNEANNSIVIGQNASSSKANGIALGEHAKAKEINSVAIGAGAIANEADTVSFGNGLQVPEGVTKEQMKEKGYIGRNKRLVNVAEGISNNDVATVGQMNKHVANNIFFFSNTDSTTPALASSYYVGSPSFKSTESNVVSFGDDKTKLKLTNVADGEKAHDAATYGQLTKVETELKGSMAGLKDEVKTSEKNAADSAKEAAKSASGAYQFAEISAEAADGAEAAKKAAEESKEKAEGFAKAAEESKGKAEGFAKAAEESKGKAEGFAKAAEESKGKAEGFAKSAEESKEETAKLTRDAGGFAESAKSAAKEAKKTAAEMDNKIKSAAEQASKEKVKEVEEKAEKLDQKVEEKTKEVKKEIKEEAKELYKYADNKADALRDESVARVGELKAEMYQGFNKLDNKINRVGKRANAGIAGVAAMTNIPYSNTDRFSVGVGLGKYHDGSAVAVGAQAKLTENVNIRASTSWNNDEGAVMGAGVAIGW
ncbi:YadA-like family protein [Xenorhabdus sp. 42]|uniref:YadA-like family protein n=1 Tax=Xenorhabdus szentirmaii TaxID=290112 RepID=UPI00198734F3|nr:MULTISPECIES: YadA-like family protein [unclassified Xenorhabdus]MBD2782685.1 YadA-like family protein [Xenorhabdus sp. 38]MBD2822387.1 YadA-like family protein [Xenorhabdus sp. 42]MBD2824563.1 YadA-like family protein [Xenorhabdus sp. 5]